MYEPYTLNMYRKEKQCYYMNKCFIEKKKPTNATNNNDETVIPYTCMDNETKK